ncbi:TPA: hypothetical protein DCE37_11415 [Candidatus Latescibacteria bacterium]|nr:hypothetical protein [Candidatus Latescibacterota bacterium]
MKKDRGQLTEKQSRRGTTRLRRRFGRNQSQEHLTAEDAEDTEGRDELVAATLLVRARNLPGLQSEKTHRACKVLLAPMSLTKAAAQVSATERSKGSRVSFEDPGPKF